MKKAISAFIHCLILGFLLSGCIRKELIISNYKQSSLRQPTISDQQNTNIIIPRIPFPEDEYNRLSRDGNATIKGTIYLTDIYGQKVYGKNTRLYLNPVTSYSMQWYTSSYIGGYKMAKEDKRLFNYLRITSSNKQGQFSFYGVPSGTYYIIGTVKCSNACGYSSIRSIRIAKEVKVSGSETIYTDLSRMTN